MHLGRGTSVTEEADEIGEVGWQDIGGMLALEFI